MSDTCKSCGAPIIWACTCKGKAMPVDAEPNPEGNVMLTRRIGMEPLATVKGKGKAADLCARLGGGIASVHTSHFATCPNAAAHRRQPWAS
jgi:hypothetical protein